MSNSKVKIVLNDAGVRELLKSSEISEACRSAATGVQARAGEEYILEERNYPERTGWAVRPGTVAAHRDNLKNNTLLKAIGK